MDLGIHFWNYTFEGGDAAILPALTATARTADEGGLAWFTVMDHWFQMDRAQPAESPMLEAYSALAHVAAITDRIRLGALVTGVTYRHPALLAKTAATLDVLSHGRAFLGLGAAWYEREHAGLGVPFPPVKERFERLEETLAICLQMWGDDDGAFEGKHYKLAETLCRPRPVQRPHPPIVIGGMGEQKTLRLVARYADACNLFPIPTEQLAHKIDVLRRHCEREGRDPAEIRITILAGGDSTRDPDAFVRQAEEWAGLGIGHVQFSARMHDPAGMVARIVDEILPRVADLEPSWP